MGLLPLRNRQNPNKPIRCRILLQVFQGKAYTYSYPCCSYRSAHNACRENSRTSLQHRPAYFSLVLLTRGISSHKNMFALNAVNSHTYSIAFMASLAFSCTHMSLFCAALNAGTSILLSISSIMRSRRQRGGIASSSTDTSPSSSGK